MTLAGARQVLTHLNVGYRDHPLQARFPPQTAGVTVRRGSFVGAGATLLAGRTVGPEAFVAAGSVVNRDVAAGRPSAACRSGRWPLSRRGVALAFRRLLRLKGGSHGFTI